MYVVHTYVECIERAAHTYNKASPRQPRHYLLSNQCRKTGLQEMAWREK